MKTILVTGGAGYVGSHTCKALAQQGFLVVSYDNLSTGFAHLVKWGPLEVGDLLDPDRLQAVMHKYQPWGIIHFAAKSDVAESVREPGAYYTTNIQGTLNLLEAMRSAQVNRIIASSTCAIYGQPKSNFAPPKHPTLNSHAPTGLASNQPLNPRLKHLVSLDEQTPIQPLSPYGQSKWAMEQLLASYQQAYGLKYTALRYFNAAGADPDLETGECHQPETHLIPLALQALRPQASSLKIFGTDYPTPDGTCVRDYVHVSDLAIAHVLALEHLDTASATPPNHSSNTPACPDSACPDSACPDSACPDTSTCSVSPACSNTPALGGLSPHTHYNLGSENGYSVQEIITKIQEITGKPVPHVLAERRAGDPAHLIASAKKAKTQLGWQPKLGLTEIISTAWRWEQKLKKS